MMRILTLIALFVLASTGCQGSLFLVDAHPELNRRFRPGIDTPGEYPY